jgi:hypothetical protein
VGPVVALLPVGEGDLVVVVVCLAGRAAGGGLVSFEGGDVDDDAGKVVV